MVTAATWIVPGGAYQTKEVDGHVQTVPNSFHSVSAVPQTLWDALKAPIRGFEEAAHIIVFILLVGGAFYVLQQTRAIDEGIEALVRRHDASPFLQKALIPIFVTFFSFGGAVFGMSEETIPFVLIFIPLALAIGYDSITGIAIPFVGAGAGFAGAFLNPFTVGIAQGIAGVPLFSGIEFRLIIWGVVTLVTIVFIMRYASKVKQNPQYSISFAVDEVKRAELLQKRAEKNAESTEWTTQHRWISGLFLLFFVLMTIGIRWAKGMQNMDAEGILLALFGIFAVGCGLMVRKSSSRVGITPRLWTVLCTFGLSLVVLVMGVTNFDWYITEIAALFLLTGILVGWQAGLSGEEITESFMNGAKDLMSTALVIGLAKAIVLIAQDGKIIHTILYTLAGWINHAGPMISAQLMFVVHTILNFFLVSGSGQAALTMPIMAPLADLIGVTRQTAVLAYQFGDGFTNLIIPTSPVTMGVLALAKITWTDWAKWMLPLQIAFFVLALVFCAIAVQIGY